MSQLGSRAQRSVLDKKDLKSKPELDAADSCKGPASAFFPRASGKEHGPARTTISTLRDLKLRTHTHVVPTLLRLGEREIRNECCCQPLSLRSFLTAARESRCEGQSRRRRSAFYPLWKRTKGNLAENGAGRPAGGALMPHHSWPIDPIGRRGPCTWMLLYYPSRWKEGFFPASPPALQQPSQ